MEIKEKYCNSSNGEAQRLVGEILTLCRTIARKPRSLVYLQKLKSEAESYANYKANRNKDPRQQGKKID